MFTVEPDRSENTLTITYAGHVSAEQTRLCGEEVRRGILEMSPGFCLVANLTALESMEIACSPFLASIMEICDSAGVAEVVRIIPDPGRDIGLQILSLFHYRSDVRIRTCSNMAEATGLLPEAAL